MRQTPDSCSGNASGKHTDSLVVYIHSSAKAGVLVGIFLLGCTWTVLAAGTWEQRAGLPFPAAGLHASTLGEQIVVVGGENWNDPHSRPETERMWAYRPGNDEWTALAPMPTGRVFLGTAVVDGQLYAVGGAAVGREHDPGLAILEAYDPNTDTWSRKADMPTPRADLTVSAAGGKIYAIGGTRHVGVDALPTVEEYDPVSDTWTRKANMPTPRLHLTSAVVDGKIYVFGGSPDWAVPLAAAEVYDPDSDTWNTLADMPTPRTGLWSAALGGKLYVMGGTGWDSEAAGSVDIYDPATDTWSTGAEMLTPRMLFAATTLEDEIYAIGGATSDFTCLSDVESFALE